jgi:diguanylate cyclase (GGDEF)-like protein/PAS domain S-box-containing protein
MTIWSFAEGFVYLSNNAYTYSFWNKIAAFGWCTFEAIVLLFVLILIGNKLIKYWYVKLLIMMPAIIFLLMALFLFGPDINTAPIIQNIFYIGDFLYNFIYLAISILLILLWGKKSKSKIRKRQAKLIVITSTIPFFLNLFVQIILPYFHVIRLPGMGQIFTLIMLFGVDHAISKYQFLSIPSALLSEEFFHEFTGFIFLTDSQGCIMKTNKQAGQLYCGKQNEIIGTNIADIFEYREVKKVFADCESIRKRIRFTDISISPKPGISIPLNITIIPLLTKSHLVRGVLVIGEDIRATKCLQEEIVKHKLTNEKLANSETKLKQNNECIIKLNKELIEMNNILKNKSIRDGLTNLYNHQYMNEVMETQLKEIELTKRNLCLMMMDIDHFKRVNDKYGHLVGDKVLKEIADLILKNTRESDYVGRYGGEEFIIMLPDTDIEMALKIAEDIRKNIQEHRFEIDNLKVTISIGVAHYTGQSLNSLINRADVLLYQAKSSGRNRVEH